MYSLRNGNRKIIEVKLEPRLKSPIKLEPRPKLEEKHGTFRNSLLHYVLEKENLNGPLWISCVVSQKAIYNINCEKRQSETMVKLKVALY